MPDKTRSVWAFLTGAAVFCAMLVNLYLIFQFAPTENSMGHVQRIFYFHVPSAWVAFLSFFVVFVCSVMYLIKRDRKYDIIASSSSEIGVIFATLVLITGPIWARPVWNTWWEWSPRLTLFLVLWFIYLAYLMLRNFVDGEERRARFSAVFGIAGFMNVPLVYMSIRLWRDIHPSPVIAGGEGSGLHPDMRAVFFFSLFTFTLLYFWLLGLRIKIEKGQISILDIKRALSLKREELTEGKVEI